MASRAFACATESPRFSKFGTFAADSCCSHTSPVLQGDSMNKSSQQPDAGRKGELAEGGRQSEGSNFRFNKLKQSAEQEAYTLEREEEQKQTSRQVGRSREIRPR